MNAWEQIKQQIAKNIPAEAFQNWFSATVFLKEDGATLVVGVPEQLTREWIEQEYAGVIAGAIRALKLPYVQVAYQIGQAAHLQPARSSAEERSEVVFSPSVNLNPKFTFETFVVGSCNQFAHAAAQAVAANPASKYNPLFIYGGVGMGKTHLMHAIGRSLSTSHGNMKIIYTSSERFMNTMISCIKSDRMQQFHRYYRTADVLLVDDIQTLSGREGTQEEFFHTFNELFEHEKQIVISSDCPPKSTPGLVERLRSRFEWGLLVDVQPPDLETKMAILDKKAESVGMRLPNDVRIFIATKTRSNVRELEGALVKLVAYSTVTGEPVNLPMAQSVLKYLTVGQDKKVTIESIVKAVAERFSLQAAQLKQKTNEQKIAYPRQIAMYLIKDLTSASLPEIGRWFGGKHHTTVLHSIQKIEKRRQQDPDLNSLLHKLVDSIH